MENTTEIEGLIAAAKNDIKRMKTLEKLYTNKAFKEIILDDYFVKEASRLALTLTDYNTQDEISQRNIDEKLRAIGHLNLFFNTILNMGRASEERLKTYEEQLANADTEVEYDDITGEELAQIEGGSNE
jgi:CO dehydrogenase/acetyl-CoA synthase gamma subunit (corrinoid Fe-S protein)